MHTIADAFRDAGAKPDEVAVFSSWEPIGIVATHDPERIVVSSGRSAGSASALIRDDPELGPLQAKGAAALADPGHDSYRPDRYTAELAIAYFRSHRPRFMFVGLGDTDEYGHRANYPGYLDALRASDRVVGEIVRSAHEWQVEGERVVIVVTSDHGRETAFKEHGRDSPESARTWLIAGGDGIAAGPSLGTTDVRRLADIAPTLLRLAGIASTDREMTGIVMTEVLSNPRDETVQLASLGSR